MAGYNWMMLGLGCWLTVAIATEGAAEGSSKIPDYPDEEVRGSHVNYTEANVGDYTLPPLLKLKNGETVIHAQMWMSQRRPEILELLREHQFAHAPERPEVMTFDVYDNETSAFDGLARRKQVTIYFTENTSTNAPQMDLLVYTPAEAKGSVPLLLNVSFSGNSQIISDSGVRPSRIWGGNG